MKPIDRLEAVLLDPDGEVCIHGSDVDRQVIKESLDQLRKENVEDDFPPTGFKATGVTGVEEYIKVQIGVGEVSDAAFADGRVKEQQKDFIREMNSILNDPDLSEWRDMLDYDIDKEVVDKLLMCIKQLRAELAKSNNLVEQWQEIAGKHEAGVFAVEYERDQLRKENRELVNALKEISKTVQARASLATKGR